MLFKSRSVTGVSIPLFVQRFPNKKYIIAEHIGLLEEFLLNKKEQIDDRLLVGMFLYTGLKRNKISSITNGDICRDKKNTLQLNSPKTTIAIKSELMTLIDEYQDTFEIVPLHDKVIKLNENDITSQLKKITKRILGTSYTPNSFSYTFIKSCLANKVDIYIISKLTLVSENTISKHLDEDDLIVDRENKALGILYRQ